MKTRLFLLTPLLLCLIFNSAHAQWNKVKYKDRLGDSVILKDKVDKKKYTKKPKPLSREFSGGPIMLSDGYGLQFNYGIAFGQEEFGANNIEKYYHNHIIQLTISERFHPKEYRNMFGGSLLNFISLKGFDEMIVYGKVNNFYNVNLSYGQRRLFGGRGEPNATIVQYFYAAGLSVGLIKPYYIETSAGMIKYSKENEPYFLDKGQISGKGGLSYGWNELSTNFGLSLKGGLHFDMAKKRGRKSALEVGAGIEYYFSPIHQMIANDPKSFFSNLYVTYQIGKRW